VTQGGAQLELDVALLFSFGLHRLPDGTDHSRRRQGSRGVSELSPEETRRVWQAIVLAPRVEVCEALLRGERVPLDQLDAEWVARLGRRPS
jgi:hypothetical protein